MRGGSSRRRPDKWFLVARRPARWPPGPWRRIDLTRQEWEAEAEAFVASFAGGKTASLLGRHYLGVDSDPKAVAKGGVTEEGPGNEPHHIAVGHRRHMRP